MGLQELGIGACYQVNCLVVAGHDAREVGEQPEVIVEAVQLPLEAAFEFVQNYSRNPRFPRCNITCRCCPREESANGICFASWLALYADRLSCFSEADVRKVEREFASCARSSSSAAAGT